MATKHGLGRGLGALIKDESSPEPDVQPQTPAQRQGDALQTASVESIIRSPFQPRRGFNEQSLAELAESIKQRGVLEPLIVRPVATGYELIAGERRLKAAVIAGLKEVPIIIRQVSDNEALEMALIENLQREDLNPLDEAEGYQTLSSRFNLTQDEIARRVGKARATVANSMRLISLPDEIKQWISNGALQPGHAKALLGIEIRDELLQLARRAVREDLSVRKLEKLVQKAQRVPRKPRATRDDIPGAYLKSLSDKLHHYFGTNVKITPSRTYANGKKAKGLLEIDFYSNEDLTRILDILNIKMD